MWHALILTLIIHVNKMAYGAKILFRCGSATNKIFNCIIATNQCERMFENIRELNVDVPDLKVSGLKTAGLLLSLLMFTLFVS